MYAPRGILAILTALAIAALSAQGAAAALPEVGRCVAKSGGSYRDAACVHKVKAGAGSFQWEHNSTASKFTATNNEGTRIEMESASGVLITCGSGTATGEYAPKTSSKGLTTTTEVKNVVIVLKSCEPPLIDANCHSKGAGFEEIVSNKLKGKLVYVSGKHTPLVVVGQRLAPETRKTAFREWVCPGVGAEFYEGEGPEKGQATVIGAVGPVNAMSTTMVEEFKGAKGVQEPQHAEGSSTIDNMEWSLSGKAKFERDSQKLTETITNEEPLEIKA
jgi:hypothetical protein